MLFIYYTSFCYNALFPLPTGSHVDFISMRVYLFIFLILIDIFPILKGIPLRIVLCFVRIFIHLIRIYYVRWSIKNCWTNKFHIQAVSFLSSLNHKHNTTYIQWWRFFQEKNHPEMEWIQMHTLIFDILHSLLRANDVPCIIAHCLVTRKFIDARNKHSEVPSIVQIK